MNIVLSNVCGFMAIVSFGTIMYAIWFVFCSDAQYKPPKQKRPKAKRKRKSVSLEIVSRPENSWRRMSIANLVTFPDGSRRMMCLSQVKQFGPLDCYTTYQSLAQPEPQPIMVAA